MNKFKQQGNIHVVIVVILVLALLGALGFIFWQNFLSKNEGTNNKTGSTTQTTDSSVKAPVLDTATFDPVFNGLKFSYPKSWTIDRSTLGSTATAADAAAAQNLLVVKSPSKKISVSYLLSPNDGLGGACSPADGGTLATFSSTQLSNFAGNSFAQYIIQTGTTYRYFSGIIDTARATSTKSGNSECEVFMADIIQLKNSENIKILQARINLTDFDNGDGSIKESLKRADIEAAYQTDEYQQAKAIMLSTSLTK